MRFKELIKKVLPQKVFDQIRDLLYPEKINILEERLNSLFLTQYREIAHPKLDQKTIFKNSEFKIYSKHGCDGILAYIYSKITPTNRKFVEIGVEDGRECNTANLSLNLGWQGLLVEANTEWAKSAELFYKEKLQDQSSNIKVACSFVTVENINQLLRDNNIVGEVDLLSIDIDGNDYWVWKAIDVINPRVLVLEYNSAFGHRSVAIKYYQEHRFRPHEGSNPLYFGASLEALTKLSKDKGYILVACDTHGHDAFFVRKDVAKEKFVELDAKNAFYPNPHNIRTIGSIETQFEKVKHLEFEEI
jgi:hypothetical protein